jgi:hypothetical protein
MSDTTEPTTPTGTAVANLDIGDLANAVKIIDFSLDQGVFKGVDAVRGVIQVRDRLAAFLESLPKAPDTTEIAPVTDASDAA